MKELDELVIAAREGIKAVVGGVAGGMVVTQVFNPESGFSGASDAAVGMFLGLIGTIAIFYLLELFAAGSSGESEN